MMWFKKKKTWAEYRSEAVQPNLTAERIQKEKDLERLEECKNWFLEVETINATERYGAPYNEILVELRADRLGVKVVTVPTDAVNDHDRRTEVWYSIQSLIKLTEKNTPPPKPIKFF